MRGLPVRFLNGHGGRKYDPARLEAYGTRDDRTGCLLWPFGDPDRDYPQISVDGRLVRLSRIVLGRKLGTDITAEQEACHTCDRPGCYEAEHLFLGSHAENLRDAAVKGRMARGLRNGAAKLTAGDVTRIRGLIASGHSLRSIAAEFSVTEGNIRAIKSGASWGWLASTEPARAEVVVRELLEVRPKGR